VVHEYWAPPMRPNQVERSGIEAAFFEDAVLQVNADDLPIARLLLGGSVPKSMIRSSLHSKLTGDFATCGGRTICEGHAVNFAQSEFVY
jgi:hypothetical protein